jgi:hypothetical protein
MSISNKVSYIDQIQDTRINNIMNSIKLLNDEIIKINEKIECLKNNYVSFDNMKTIIDDINENINDSSKSVSPVNASINENEINKINEVLQNQQCDIEKIQLDVNNICIQIGNLNTMYKQNAPVVPPVNTQFLKIKRKSIIEKST